jgi:hypothetical protein
MGMSEEQEIGRLVIAFALVNVGLEVVSAL